MNVTALYNSVFVVCYVGKVLIIGGGIANFTNVAATFKVSMCCMILFTLADLCHTNANIVKLSG